MNLSNKLKTGGLTVGVLLGLRSPATAELMSLGPGLISC